jgi:hypothetical protein
MVAFVVLTAFATVELLVLSDVADRYWAWTIRTELTAAFLGAAYASGFALSVLALRQDRWSRIRVSVVTVTVFTVLTSVATIIHMHRLLLESGGAGRGLGLARRLSRDPGRLPAGSGPTGVPPV